MENVHSSVSYNANSKPHLYPSTVDKKFIVLHETRYFLNPSRSKYISIGIYFKDNCFNPCVCIGGVKFKNFVLLDDGDWGRFLTFKQQITSSMANFENSESIKLNSCTITFENFNDLTVLKLEDYFANSVYLANESLVGLWNLSEIIQYRLDVLKALNFDRYFKNILSTIPPYVHGNLVDNIYRKIQPANSPLSENVCIALEFVNLHYPFLEDWFQKPYGYFCANKSAFQ